MLKKHCILRILAALNNENSNENPVNWNMRRQLYGIPRRILRGERFLVRRL